MSRKHLPALATFVTVAALCFVQPTPFAYADVSLESKAASQTLFDEGRRLMSQGQYAEACPKLAESQRLDPGIGTQFNLADCLEHIGRTASSWAGFLEVASLAKAAGQPERERVALDRAARLAPRLSRLSISRALSTLPYPEPSEIWRDGERVATVLWGTAVPVDPGTHSVEVRVPGKAPWRRLVEVRPGGDLATLILPAMGELADAPAVPSRTGDVREPAVGTRADQAASGWKHGALALGIGGVVGLGLGGILALVAKNSYNESLKNCRTDIDNPNLCNPVGVEQRNRARSEADVATVAVGIGAGALAGGIVVFLFGPSARSSAESSKQSFSQGSSKAGVGTLGAPHITQLEPSLAPERAGLVLKGRF